MTPIIEILGQKFAHFDRLEGSFLAILEVKKVVFLTFSKITLPHTLCYPYQMLSFGVPQRPTKCERSEPSLRFEIFTPLRHKLFDVLFPKGEVP